MFELIEKIIYESWQVLGQMSPYLIFGFLMAGVLSVYISAELVEKHLGGTGFMPVFKASIFGVPLPLCSCSVIPVSTSFYRHGASRAATTSFLLSTPQTGVDSIMVTYSLLGPVFAIFRPLAALITGFVGGGLVQLFDNNSSKQETNANNEVCSDGCCDTEEQQSSFLRMLRYGFITLPQDIGVSLLIGILIAGIMSALVPPAYLNAYIGGGFISIIILVAAGVPIYVCATASVPIALGFMHMGASPGAALAFLIAGPATNAATFTTIFKVLGRRSAFLFLITVAVSAIGCGLFLDWLMPLINASIPELSMHSHQHEGAGMLVNGGAVVLLTIIGYAFFTKYRKKQKDMGNLANMTDNKIELQVSGMTCGHCQGRVEQALQKCNGVENVHVDLKTGKVTVSGKNMDTGQLTSEVTEAGYEAELK